MKTNNKCMNTYEYWINSSLTFVAILHVFNEVDFFQGPALATRDGESYYKKLLSFKYHNKVPFSGKLKQEINTRYTFINRFNK